MSSHVPVKRLIKCALALALCASAADAQTALRVRAESDLRTPLAGALIALVDSANRVVVEALSSVNGYVSLDAAPGTYRVRVRRVGFRPFYSAPMPVPAADLLVLRVESPRVVLNELVVSASAQCGRINRDAETLASLWEEISKALRSSQLTVADLKEISKVQTYIREVRSNGEVTSSDTMSRSVTNRRPFAAVDPASLVSLGYVRGNETIGWEVFAPDEVVLLSEGFASTHCFRALRQRDKPGQIGVAFEPAPKRRQPDIRGVIWLDERSSELREVQFRFVNAGMFSEFRPGGYTRFRRMLSGAWIVSDWELQLPRLGMNASARKEARVIGMIHNGGRILIADAPAQSAQRFKVSGLIFDSLFLSPLKGAVVSAAGSSVKTDEAGRFELSGLPPGPQLITFSHRVVSSLGLLAYETQVDLHRDTSLVLATPSRRTAWMRICLHKPDSSEETQKGILHGVVRNETGNPLDSAIVTIRLDDPGAAPGGAPSAQKSVAEVRTNRDGHYAVCGFRRLATGTVAATRGSIVSERKGFEFGTGMVIRKDLTIDRSGPRENTSIRDLIVSVTDSAGDAVADALVNIDGTASSARTNEDGRALLRTEARDLTVTVRRSGYAGQNIQIRLGESRRQLLKVVLAIAERPV